MAIRVERRIQQAAFRSSAYFAGVPGPTLEESHREARLGARHRDAGAAAPSFADELQPVVKSLPRRALS